LRFEYSAGLDAQQGGKLNGEDLSGLRVLLVEDELHVQLLMEDFLEELGCKVQAVSTYDEALRAAGSAAVDAAVLDVNLHGQKSFPVAEVLARRDIPIVFSTGYGSQGIDAAWRERPWLQKPFVSEQLAQALRAALSLGAGRRSASP
jgi:CheY-like chemotaxis protein